MENLDGTISVTDFINKELVQYSIAACNRAIPSLIDGLKTTQRKILFTCLKKKIKVLNLLHFI